MSPSSPEPISVLNDDAESSEADGEIDCGHQRNFFFFPSLSHGSRLHLWLYVGAVGGASGRAVGRVVGGVVGGLAESNMPRTGDGVLATLREHAERTSGAVVTHQATEGHC